MKKLFKSLLIAACVFTFANSGQAEAANVEVQVADVGAQVFVQRYNALAPNGNSDVSIRLEPFGSNAVYDNYAGFVNRTHAVMLFVNKAGYVSKFTILGTDVSTLAGMYACAMAGAGFSVDHNHNRVNTLARALDGLQLTNRDERWSTFFSPELNRSFLMWKHHDPRVGNVIEVSAFVNNGSAS